MPPALKAELDRLLRENFTLDQVLAHLGKLGGDESLPSRSSIGRYAKTFEAIAERMRRSQEITDRLVEAAGPSIADGKGFQVLVQGFQSLAFDFLANVGEGQTLDAENLSFFARSLSSLAGAQKSDADRTFKIEERAAKKAREEAAVNAVTAARAVGLTADKVKQIERAVLGVDA